MKKFLTLTGFLCAGMAVAWAQQTIYFQGAQSPGQLSVVGQGQAGAVPYVGPNGSANVVSTLSCRMTATGDSPASPAASSYTSQTPVITEFYYAETYNVAPCTATGAAVYNTATLSGNMKLGLANASGAILATTASTAAAGTTAYQLIPFTAAINVPPGTYYLLAFYDNATIRANAFTAGSFAAAKVTGQTYATGFTAFTPATTFTTALGPVISLY